MSNLLYDIELTALLQLLMPSTSVLSVS